MRVDGEVFEDLVRAANDEESILDLLGAHRSRHQRLGPLPEGKALRENGGRRQPEHHRDDGQRAIHGPQW